MLERVRRAAELSGISVERWPERYINRDRGHYYEPHTDAEQEAVFDLTPRFVLFRGGEGSGKTTSGSIKALERIKRGMSGIAVAPDLPHFRRSTWPEFRRWIPWEFVVERQRYRGSIEWSPTSAFELVFTTGAVVYCGGIDVPGSWEGPNVSWAWFDEARKKKDPAALKVLNGRVRIPGPDGEPPQLWLTTTPLKHWLFEYFGPVKTDEPDPRRAFKQRRRDVVMLTADNIRHLDADYVEDRAAGLSEMEKIVLLEGGWEDIDDADHFLASMIWWDECRDDLPPLDKNEPAIMVADASVSGDSFGVMLITRHPDSARRDDVAVRFAQAWDPGGEKLAYATPERDGPEDVMRRLCQRFNVKYLIYDEYQLHDMATRFTRERLVRTEDFPQGSRRLAADTALHDRIIRRGIAHDGNGDLTQHVGNANRKMDDDRRRMRIVKRTDSQKVDLAVCLSMGAYEIERLPMGLPVDFA